MSTRATLAGAGAFLCCAQRLVDRPSRWRPGIATVGAPGTIGLVQEEAPQVEAATAKTSTAQEQTETSALTRTSKQHPDYQPIRHGTLLLRSETAEKVVTVLVSFRPL